MRKLLDGKYQIIPEVNIEMVAQIRVPDLAIYQSITFTPGEDEIYVKEMPQGIIEILSPTQQISELLKKASAYFQGGIKSYWLVIPDLKTIYVFNYTNQYEVFAKDMMVEDNALDIKLPLTSIFR